MLYKQSRNLQRSKYIYKLLHKLHSPTIYNKINKKASQSSIIFGFLYLTSHFDKHQTPPCMSYCHAKSMLGQTSSQNDKKHGKKDFVLANKVGPTLVIICPFWCELSDC